VSTWTSRGFYICKAHEHSKKRMYECHDIGVYASEAKEQCVTPQRKLPLHHCAPPAVSAFTESNTRRCSEVLLKHNPAIEWGQREVLLGHRLART
jgi:hypothetical protein